MRENRGRVSFFGSFPPMPMETVPLRQSPGLRLTREALPEALHPYLVEVAEQCLPAPPAEPYRFAFSATTAPNLNVTPEGFVRIVMPEACGGQRVVLDAFSLAGPQPNPFVVEVTAAVRGLDVVFTPVGPFALLGVTGYGLTPAGPPPLDAVVRPGLAAAVRAWRAVVLAPPPAGAPPDEAFAERAARIVAFLAARVPEAPPETEFLQRAVAAIEAAPGNVRVADLAETLGVSPATLRRRFAVLGVPVKVFAAITRFRRAHVFLATTPGATWADAALRFGYADQAHLVREHRRFSGAPPTRWADDDRFFDRDLGLGGQPEAPPRAA